MSKIKVVLMILMSILTTVVYGAPIKTGQTVTVSFDALPGDYGFEWSTTNTTLQLSSSSTICHVYCQAPFSGTAIVKCSYKFRVGNSYTNASKSWSFTYNSTGDDGGGGGGSTETGHVKLSSTSVNIQEYETQFITIDQSLHDIEWTVFDSSIASIEPRYGGFQLDITGCKPGTTYARVSGRYLNTQLLEGLVCINVSKRNYQDGELIKYKNSDIDLNFKVISRNERTAALTYVSWLRDESKFEIPSQVEGLQVTQIGWENSYSVFSSYRPTLKSIIIPSTVTTISDNAFEACTALEEIELPKSLTTLGTCAFYRCTNIDHLNLPGSIKQIGRAAFSKCTSLKNIFFEQGITSLGSNMFSLCTSLETIDLPKTLVKIGDDCFNACDNLNNIYIPSTLQSIGSFAFRKCAKIENVYIADLSSWCKVNMGTNAGTNPLGYAENLIYNNNCIEDLVIPEDVEVIGYGAFQGYKKLKSLVMPNSVKKIDGYAFYNCNNLTNILLTNPTPLEITDYTFSSGSYENVKLVIPANLISTYRSHELWGRFKTIESVTAQDSPDEFSYQGVNYVVMDREAGTCQTKPGTYSTGGSSVSGNLVIPSTVSNGKDTFKVVSIGCSSFLENKELTSIELPSTVRMVGEDALSFCENLSEVKLSNGLSIIGERAFFLTNISSLVLPSTITKIKSFAFAFSRLSDIFIPKSVSLIEPGAFYCANFNNDKGVIKSIDVDSENMNYTSNDGVLFDKAMNTLLCFPSGKIQDKYVIPNTVRTIEEHSFQGSQISSIVIPNTTTKLGEYSFASSLIKSIKIPKDIQEIGSNAFYDCDNLSEIYYNTDNPISISYDIFDKYSHYANATLYVPAESINKFKQTIPWKYFSKLEAYEFSSEEAIIADSEPPIYYDLQGMRIETPTKGRLYIRLHNGKAEKVFIR